MFCANMQKFQECCIVPRSWEISFNNLNAERTVPQLKRDPVGCLKYVKISNGASKFCNYRCGSDQVRTTLSTFRGGKTKLHRRTGRARAKDAAPQFWTNRLRFDFFFMESSFYNTTTRPILKKINAFATYLSIAGNCWIYGLYED